MSMYHDDHHIVLGCGTLDGLGGAMAWPSNNPKKTAHKKTACGLQYVCVFIEHINIQSQDY